LAISFAAIGDLGKQKEKVMVLEEGNKNCKNVYSLKIKYG
jgi:hypothetical protein